MQVVKVSSPLIPSLAFKNLGHDRLAYSEKILEKDSLSIKKEEVKSYALLLLDRELLSGVISNDINNKKLQDCIIKLSENNELRVAVFNKIKNAVDKVMVDADPKEQQELIAIRSYIQTLQNMELDYLPSYFYGDNAVVAFKGELGDKLLDTGEKFGLPALRTIKTIQHAANGNGKAAAKAGVAAVDNYALHGIKQAAASGAAAKGAAIGGAVGGPVGAAV